MISQVFHSLQTLIKRLTILALSVVMFLSFMQTATVAAPRHDAEPGIAPGINQPVAGKDIDELRRQRNEWQSQASALHDRNNNDEDKSLGEVVKDKLNLDEITEGYDPERETEKAYQRDPLGSR